MEETINIPVKGFKHVKTIPYELYGFQLLKDGRYSWYNKTLQTSEIVNPKKDFQVDISIPSKDSGVLFP